MTEPQLPFTGERFTPECVREMAYEHWHRYALAAGLARGRRVLDAACGEGYGSAMLARAGAASVLGVDLSAATVAHASARYPLANLRFAEGDCTRLEGLPEGGFDLITSFETLEHVQAQERMIERFASLLSPEGVVLVSSPDRRTYSELRGYRNEFHVRELDREELQALLGAYFPAVRLYGHKLLFQSAIWALAAAEGRYRATTAGGDADLVQGLAYAPLYYLAACARNEAALQGLCELSLYGDAAESVYAHYDEQVRANIRAGHRIAELERELERLRGDATGRG
ncbi:MAG TPA: class I SAM-dependent methyltransferase [Xanthomonadaceae bacterium]|nr:class I SAM-dependent methyltransferase [Xanthomonadaceae bacterium]